LADNFFEEKIRIARLYDCYGNLLTDRQRNCMERYFYEDLSLAEIADELKVSRQAVHDMLKRAEQLLEKYESKLNFLENKKLENKKIKEIIDELKILSKENKLDKNNEFKEIINILREICSED
jgi:predicted DNA-binding protein YlxM (UPF0122 family)